jgi:hypothetical protein
MSDRAHSERGNLGPVLFGVLAFLIVVALLAGLRAGIAF